MKGLTILSVLFIFCCCQQKPKKDNALSHYELHPGYKHEKELSKARDTFNSKLLELYNSDLSYQKTILKADSLIIELKRNPSKLMSEMSEFCVKDIHQLKAELYYKNNEFKKSTDEINKAVGDYPYVMGDNATCLAANYIKLKDFKNAKSFVDSIRKGDYIVNFAKANYYECVRDKSNAVKYYELIVNDLSAKRRFYYKVSIQRLQELNKKNILFLDEMIFPTSKPNSETFMQ